MSRDEEQIRVRCPDCRAKYRVPASKAGRSVRCAHCQTKFRIPTLKPSAKHVPTEEDILSWLNEGSDEDYVAPRPRVARMPSIAEPVPVNHTSTKDPSATRKPDTKAPVKSTSRTTHAETDGDVLNDPMVFRKTG